MDARIDTPKIFISYSWKPEFNKQMTLRLAERLESQGVHVIIDEWDLSEGQDKYKFMEQMANDKEVKKVLLICNKDYSEKANNKIGGVGIESLIISDEIYNNADQTKFIPVISEKDDTGKPYLPTFIKSRMYIDLSDETTYEDQYEKLLRNLFDKPASRRPPRGTPPSYILNENAVFLRTIDKVAAIKFALLNEKKNSQILINDYFDSFIGALDDFKINESNDSKNPIDEIILHKIDDLKPLRNDYVNFLEIILTYSNNIEVERLIRFFEDIISFSKGLDSNKYPDRTIGRYMYDYFYFFFYEIFLYTAITMIEKQRFAELSEVLYNDFMVFEENSAVQVYTYTSLNRYLESLNEHRNKRLDLRRLNVTADIIKQRADLPKYSFEKLMEADTILYYISLFRPKIKDQWLYANWLPQTTVYHLRRCTVFDKMMSRKYFEKIKPLFLVSSIDDLKLKIEIIKQNRESVGYNYYFPSIDSAFDFKRIGIYK